MKISLIAESYPPALGGAEFALQNLVDGFVQRGHEVWVVTSSWQRHDAGTEQTGNLRLTRVKTLSFFHRMWFILFSLPTVLKAARWADVVVGSTFAGGPPAFFGAWLAGKRRLLIVLEVWGHRWSQFEPSRLRSMFYRTTESIIVRLAFDRYIAISHYTKRCLVAIGVTEEKIDVVHLGDSTMSINGVDRVRVRNELGLGPDDFVYLCFGRVGISKGFEYFAAAIPRLVDDLPRSQFILILSGYDRRILGQVRGSLAGVSETRCRLLSPVSRDDLANFMSAADCVVIPSLSEGFGFSALEACNAGKVVVSTDAGSLPEVVFGKHVFVKPGSAQALTEGCVKAFNGEVEVSPPREFKWSEAVEGYLKLYEQLLQK
jgi:glycosyltransferase involved in cell wall biosynthesis